MASQQAMIDFIEKNVTADLQYLWSDAGVEIKDQYDVAQHYRNVRRFASMADDRTDLKKALKDDYGVDPTAGAADRARVAALVCAFESAKDFVEQEAKLRAEHKVLGTTRAISASDKVVMRKAVETVYGQLPDKECPSPEYLAVKLEEIEDGEYVASSLDVITSRAEVTGLDIETSLDSSGVMRVVRKKQKGKIPVDTEEYRTKLRVESNAWLMIQSKMKSKAFLQGLTPNSFGKFTDYVLGDRVATLKVPDPTSGTMVAVSPPWNIVLHYEYKMREAAFRLVRDDQITLDEALKRVVRDSELKELRFTGILALSRKNTTGGQATTSEPQAKWPRKGKKGDSKGSFSGGKGKKGSGKQKGKAVRLLWKTEDGRNICFNYNSSKGCKGSCGMVHICRYPGCGQSHSAMGNHQHPGLS
jgi:hypothetical protein